MIISDCEVMRGQQYHGRQLSGQGFLLFALKEGLSEEVASELSKDHKEPALCL